MIISGSRSRGQGKVRLTFFFVCAAWYMFLGLFCQEREMTIEHFLNGPSRTQFENRENPEIVGNRMKSGLFRSSKHQKYVNFQDLCMTFCVHIHLPEFFRIFFGRSKIRRKNPIFKNILVFIIFKIFKICKIQENVLIETSI